MKIIKSINFKTYWFDLKLNNFYFVVNKRDFYFLEEKNIKTNFFRFTWNDNPAIDLEFRYKILGLKTDRYIDDECIILIFTEWLEGKQKFKPNPNIKFTEYFFEETIEE